MPRPFRRERILAAAEADGDRNTDDEVEEAVEEYNELSAMFQTLVQQLHVPFMERRLYEKYLLRSFSKENLQHLRTTVALYSHHKKCTVAVLASIQAREEALTALFQTANEISRLPDGNYTSLEAQADIMACLMTLRAATAEVIQRISHWREGLTRPYPFCWRSKNYLVKILDDCRIVDACSVADLVPVNMTARPLLSDLANPASASGDNSQKQMRRFMRMEGYLRSERASQETLTNELKALSDDSLFLPLVSSPVVPGCKSGVRLKKHVWQVQWQEALSATLDRLHQPSDPLAAVRDLQGGHDISIASSALMASPPPRPPTSDVVAADGSESDGDE